MRVFPYDTGAVAPQYDSVFLPSRQLPENVNGSFNGSIGEGGTATTGQVSSFDPIPVPISYEPYTAWSQGNRGQPIDVKKVDLPSTTVLQGKDGYKGALNEDALDKVISSGHKYALSSMSNNLIKTAFLGGST